MANNSKNVKSVNINGNEYSLLKSKFTVNESPIHISDYMSGKMAGLPSISTSCLDNPICQARMKDGNSICAHCFAAATLNQYKTCGEHASNNLRLLSENVLALDLLPVFGNVRFVRIESFGDVANVNQAINYLNIAKVNPEVTFAWWSKNMSIIAKAIEIIGRPENIIFIESSERVNVAKAKSFDFIDYVFTVYDKKYIKENSVNINCGARRCLACGRCYHKGNSEQVREQLK